MSVPRFREHRIPASRVRALCWSGDDLIDWVAGGNRYHLDGTTIPRHVNYAYRFDMATVSPSGDFAVIYERLGTKGLVLHHGEVLREINRSFYFAHVYEYPVALIRSPDGCELIVHCPEHYNQLVIDDLRTGERVVEAVGHSPGGPFHSRLAINCDGNLLLDAGWVWHPWDYVSVHDIAEVSVIPPSWRIGVASDRKRRPRLVPLPSTADRCSSSPHQNL